MQSQRSRPKPSHKDQFSVLSSQFSESFTFEAIGTAWIIELTDAPAGILKKIKKRIEEFDKNYSRFRRDSLVSKMSLKAGTFALPSDAKPMLDMYLKLYKLSDGLVTPLIGQTLSDAGYDADYSLRPGAVRPSPAWEECLEYDFPKLTIKKPVLLDFGAVGKGYLVDIIVALLKDNHARQFVINAGGDILCYGYEQVEIALEDPRDSSLAVGVATLKDQAICGSAGNRRAWAGYTHIMNPKSPSEPERYKAVWACAGSCMLADALTTAVYFCSAELLAKHFSFEYAIMNNDNSVEHSVRFPAVFFNQESK